MPAPWNGQPIDPWVDEPWASQVLTVEKLKSSYLFGIPLTSPRTGQTFSDSDILELIKVGYDYIYQLYDVQVLPLWVPNESLDYYRDEAMKSYFKLQFKHTPIMYHMEAREDFLLKVQGFFGTNLSVFDYPSDWFRVYPENGSLHIYPTFGSTGTFISTYTSLNFALSSARSEFVPGFFRVSYYAGMEKIPPIINGIVGKVAAIYIMNIIGPGLMGIGIQSFSISIDGLSNSVNTTNNPMMHPLSGTVRSYQEQLESEIELLRARYGAPIVLAD